MCQKENEVVQKPRMQERKDARDEYERHCQKHSNLKSKNSQNQSNSKVKQMRKLDDLTPGQRF